MVILEAGAQTPWWVAAIVIPMMGLFIWLVRTTVGGMKTSMKEMSDRLVQVIESGNRVQSKFILDARVQHIQENVVHDSMATDVKELVQAQRQGRSCRFSDVDVDLMTRAAKKGVGQNGERKD